MISAAGQLVDPASATAGAAGACAAGTAPDAYVPATRATRNADHRLTAIAVALPLLVPSVVQSGQLAQASDIPL
jgi:hypothetical protein